tara:strand:+ start:17611 stop:18912 length:1302 start_codon:yes stop_codon:yes gene_type:complete
MATRTKNKKSTQRIPADIKALQEEALKLHGEGVVVMGNKKPLANHIPTGVFILDFALLGGLAQGYVAMGYGYESCGKTTQFLKVAANYQKKHPNMWVGWIDAEGMYDPLWAEKNGLDPNRIIVSQPEYGELAVDIYEDMLTRESIGLIVVDSIPSIVPMKVIENSAEDDTMAAGARLMGKLCSKLTMGNNKERRKGHWTTTLLINQWRTKVGFVMGDPRVLPGGRQINHIPTTKIELKKIKTHLTKDSCGNEVALMDECAFKLEKVKHGQSLRTGEFQLYLSADNEMEVPEGMVDNISTVTAFAKKMGFVRGGGTSWRLLTENVKLKSKLAVEAFTAKHEARNEKLVKADKKPLEIDEELLEKVRTDNLEIRKFRTLDSIKGYLRSEQEEYECLARSLISAQRVSKGLPALPPDGYLVAQGGRLVTTEHVEAL